MSEKDETVELGSLDFIVVSSYTLDQALADEVLHTFAQERWHQLSGGKPIVMTHAIYSEVSLSGLVEIWNQFVHWRREVMPHLPEDERMFTTTMSNQAVWIIEDGAAFTILYPADY